MFTIFVEVSAEIIQQELFQSCSFSTDDKQCENSPVKKANENDLQLSEIEESPDFIDSLEDLVRREINDRGIEAVVKDCAEHSTRKCYVRDRSDKTDKQVKAMIEALPPNQTQLPKWKRVKLGKKIGLSESQIYKWYYDTYHSA